MRFEVGNLKLFGLDLSQLLSWWVRGLSDSLPSGLPAAFLRPAPRVQAVIDGTFLRLYRFNGPVLREVARLDLDSLPLTLDAVLRADALGSKTNNPELIQLELCVPAAQVLRKELNLPREVRNELREVIGYQVGRLTPFSADKLYYDARICSQDKQDPQMLVELAAVPKAYADPWIEHVERLTGLRVSRLYVLDDPSMLNLFGRPRVSGQWWRRLNLNSVLLLCLVLALGTAILAPLYKQRALVIERKEQITNLQAEAAGLMATQEALEKNLAALNLMVESRAKRPQISMVLAEMSKVVPDSIYMGDLRILGDTLTMSGFGTDVVELIALINGSKWFADARFASPVSRNPSTGLDQFTVTARLTMPAANQ
ncbi:MAG: PilN domain-containing protein [Pseudomonadota bacterium]